MRSRHNFTTETRSTRRFTEQQSRNQKTSPRRRGERGGLPWERTLPACSAFLTPRTQDACALRRIQKNPLQAAKDFQLSSTKQQSRDQSMNETTDEHRFICGVVQSTPAPKKDFVIQGFFDSRFVRSAKKTPQGHREHRVSLRPCGEQRHLLKSTEARRQAVP